MLTKIISFVVLLSTVSNLAFADCDYTKIKENSDGSYTYTKELHLCVGSMKKELESTKTQVVELQKAIKLKDLALDMSEKKANVWMDSNAQVVDRLDKIEELYKRNEWIYFGLGALTVVASGFAISAAIKH